MELEVRIERLGAQGDGVAQGTNGLLFVPFTLPGERVQVAIKPSKDHAEPLAILEPSPDRVAPVCPHLGSAAAVRSSIWRAKPTLPGNGEQVLAVLVLRFLAEA